MSGPSVPLSMLVTKDVPYEWHDGVALVAQLVTQVRSDVAPNAASRIPDLRGITLEENGTLTLSVHPDQAMPAMPGAPQILQQLLSGKDQPAPLRLFGMQAATADPAPTLDEFSDELAKWERPGRGAKLVGLYARALQQIGPAALTEEAKAREERALTALADRKQGGSERTAKSKVKTGQKSTTGSRGPVVALVLIMLAVAAAGAAWVMLGRPTPGQLTERIDAVLQNSSSPDESPAATESAAPQPSTTATPQRRAGAARPADLSKAQAELARGRAMFDQQEYAAATNAFDVVIEELGGQTSQQAADMRQTARDLGEVSRAAVAEAAATARLEFRSGDPGVTDPVPLAYLPPRPDPSTPPEKLQVLEVRVNAEGRVDSAKFVMNRPSFRNSWWTSAAKAWRFQPATKDGKPVRFVMRIVMDDSASQR